MELKEAIFIARGKIKTILAVSVITAISAFIFSAIQPVAYETSLSLLISKESSQETTDFKYDGYYAFQTSEIFADSIQEWMKSPETVNEIYQEAGVGQDFKNIKSYGKKFTAKKMSPQYTEVKFKTEKRDEAEKISSAIVKVINNKAKRIQENSKQEITNDNFLPKTSANAPVGISQIKSVVKKARFTRLTSKRFSPFEIKYVT